MTEDIRLFLDALKIREVILVGHSMAGDELTRFAGIYPAQVIKLVYLDAAYEIVIATPRGIEFAMPNHVAQAIAKGTEESHPDYTKVKAPALGVYAISSLSSFFLANPCSGCTNKGQGTRLLG